MPDRLADHSPAQTPMWSRVPRPCPRWPRWW